MKTFREFLYEKREMELDDIVSFVSSLNIPKRKPRSIDKAEHSIMVRLSEVVREYKSSSSRDKNYYEQLIKQNWGYLRKSKEELESVYGGLDSKSNVIKGKYAEYIKFDVSSYEKFKGRVKDVEDFLGELKGYHKKVLNNLKIKFVSSGEMKSKAKYSVEKDILLINASSLGNTKEEYGSLRYVVLHELGHRYLRYHPQNWNYDAIEWATTPYSKKDSFIGEEKFAELFAMSHWKNKYKEYKDKIEKFEDML